jgi:hypothetical protein
MSRFWALFVGGMLICSAMLSARSAVAQEISVEPIAAGPGEVWTVSGAPHPTRVAWSLVREREVFPLPGATYDSDGFTRIVVPSVEPGPYDLVGRWGSQEFPESVSTGVVVLASETPTASPAPATSAELPARRAQETPGASSRGAEVDEDSGFELVADPEVSLAIDAALVALAVLVLWRSRWIRRVVVESLRHPLTTVTLDRGGRRR